MPDVLQTDATQEAADLECAALLTEENEIEERSTDDIKIKLVLRNKVIQKSKNLSYEDLESTQTSLPAQTPCFPRDYGGH